MGLLLSKIRGDIRQAMLDHDDLRKDILRVVVGEVQRKLDADKDEDVVRAIRKIIEGNLESLTHIENPKLKKENEILAEYLPVLWSFDETEAFFLNSETPVFEQIRDAKNDGAAIGIAMKTLKAANAPVDSKIVQEIVKKIRG